MANRVTEVNRELRLRGIAEKLARGKGHYFFRDGEAPNWRSSTVAIFSADRLSVREWLGKWSDLSGKPVPERIADRPAMRLCRWFARCDNPAVTTQPHPTLGLVPICQICADKMAAIT
jgi:hypothetical protein